MVILTQTVHFVLLIVVRKFLIENHLKSSTKLVTGGILKWINVRISRTCLLFYYGFLGDSLRAFEELFFLVVIEAARKKDLFGKKGKFQGAVIFFIQRD